MPIPTSLSVKSSSSSSPTYRRMAMPPRRRSVPLSAVFATILILFGFLIFLLVYDDLRRQLWVQGMAGVVMTLIVAVILFSIVDSTINVSRAPIVGVLITGGGAAIFYLLLLPQIKHFFFPTHS